MDSKPLKILVGVKGSIGTSAALSSTRGFSTPVFSSAEMNALRLARTTAKAFGGIVTTVYVGDAEEDRQLLLQEALIYGSDEAISIPCTEASTSESAPHHIFATYAEQVSADVIFCGEYSLGRASGTFGPHLASLLNFALLCGVTDLQASSEELTAVLALTPSTRAYAPLQRGSIVNCTANDAVPEPPQLSRRLAVAQGLFAPKIVSIYPSTARTVEAPGEEITTRRPPLPRAAPIGSSANERLTSMIGHTKPSSSSTIYERDPKECAAVLLEQLRTWGVRLTNDPPR